MAYENLCMYCFEEMNGASVCPHCGRDSHAAVPQVQMLPGTLVYNNRFLIGRALGQDASGIVYAAYDTKRASRLRVREYLPRDCAERLNDGAVVPLSGKEDQFEAGLKKLRASVDREEDPKKRHFFFEENGTAYIAQRKSTAAAAQAEDAVEEESDGGDNRRRVAIIAGIAAAVVIIAAVVLILLFNGVLSPARDITQNPTLDPNQVWIPAETPTPTPYVAPTFAALVDPDLSWMDYTYNGDVDAEYTSKTTPTPLPTLAPTATGAVQSKYTLVSRRSTAAEIRALQQKLVTLGWLGYTGITGEYDNATLQAVKDFQSYINTAFNPAEKLEVDGIAGAKTQRWLYETTAVKPTATPTPAVTAQPGNSGTIDNGSTASEIRRVQRGLVYLGVLPEGSETGRYDDATTAAVRRFQVRVNQLAGYDVLETNGRMDPLSLAFMEYYMREYAARVTPTPAPTPAPTATRMVTATPQPDSTQYIANDTVDANSSADAIRRVQQMLVSIGMLPRGGDDGVYGTATIAAVSEFQQWVNTQRNDNILTVNGEADALTQAYLEYCQRNNLLPHGTPTPVPTATPSPTPTVAVTETPYIPTPSPTPEPTPTEEPLPDENVEITVDANSDPDSIRFVQQMLQQVGLLDARGVDGIFGRGTASAILAFQQWTNSQRGDNLLPETGAFDNATRLALEYAVDHGLKVGGDTTPVPTEAPTEIPAAPTDAPTQAPTDTPAPTEIPTAEPRKSNISNVQVAIGDVLAGNDVVAVSEGRFQVRWHADGDVASYYVYVDDSSGNSIIAQEAVPNTEFNVNTSLMAPGEVYTLTLGVMPVDGADEDMVWRVVQFTLPDENAAEPQPTAAQDIGDVETGATDALTDAPTDTPEPEPTETPAPTDTPEPTRAVAEVSAPNIVIAGQSANDGLVGIEDDTFTISWAAEGEAAAYALRITDANDNVILERANITQTSFTANASQISRNMVYTITVGVLPVNGAQEDIKWSSGQFTLAEKPTPEPTEEPTPEPTEVPTPEPTVGQVGSPVITVDGAAYQQDGIPVITGDTIILSWAADGAVDSYVVYVENQNGERQSLGSTTDTSRTLSTANLPAGAYTLYVGALPVNGGEGDIQWSSASFAIPTPTVAPTAVPTQAPTAEPVVTDTPAPTEPPIDLNVPVTAQTDPVSIQQVQIRLYQFGILPANGVEIGALDETTLRAVAEFQTRVNAQYEGANLPVIDPADPYATIDVQTLRFLFTENLELRPVIQ